MGPQVQVVLRITPLPSPEHQSSLLTFRLGARSARARPRAGSRSERYDAPSLRPAKVGCWPGRLLAGHCSMIARTSCEIVRTARSACARAASYQDEAHEGDANG